MKIVPKWVRIAIGLVLAALLCFAGYRSQAQTVVPPLTFQTTISHTSCPAAVANVTQYCFASDGLFVSINGAPYAQLNAVGVSSLTVCNAAGANCGSAQAGAVTVNIPKGATTTLQ